MLNKAKLIESIDHKKFVQKVLKKAGERIAAFTDSDSNTHTMYNFWRSFAYFGAGGPIEEQQEKSTIVRDHFFQVASLEQKQIFIRLQEALLDRLNAELLKAGKKDFFHFENTQEEYFSYPHGLLDYITSQPEKFLPIKTLSVFFKFHAYAARVLKKEQDVSKELLGWSLAKALEKDFRHFYQRPATCMSIFDRLTDLDQRRGLKSALDEYRKKAPKRISVQEIKPNTIRPAFDISVEFMKETQRPGRGDNRIAGGRAGWGPQKPDLWKPENK